MSDKEMTKIEWAHYTFNPWWGCTKVSPGCTNCYAETLDARFKGDHWGPKAGRRFFGEKHWNNPLRWNRKAEKEGVRRRVFCASMADVFEEHGNSETNSMMGEARSQLWKLIENTPHLDWMLLTKRPENHDLVPLAWQTGSRRPNNIWLGTTAENQEQADERIPHLINAPWPAVRFVSYEPAIEGVDFDPPHCQFGCNERYGRSVHISEFTLFCNHCESEMGFGAWLDPLNGGIDWLIAGAESGPGARAMDERWIREVRDQCKEGNVPFFYKQRIERGRKVSLPELDGQVHAEFPVSRSAER